MTSDQLDDLVSVLDPIDEDELRRDWRAAHARTALRDDVLGRTRRRAAAPGRQRRIVTAIAAMAILAATGWTSYRLLTADPTDGFGCRRPNDVAVVIDLQSGDYVADCAAQWTLRGVEPPPLTAYERPAAGGPVVEVVPSSESVPDSWTPVNATDADDMALLELESQLDDYVDGLRASCRDATSAVRFARNELNRLGLTTWSVTTQPPGPRDCATAIVDVGQATVSIRPGDDGQPAAETSSWMAYAIALREAVAEQCLDVVTAEATARDLAVRIDSERATASYADATLAEGLVVTSIVDDTRSCTKVDLNVYGMANLKLRGPTSPR